MASYVSSEDLLGVTRVKRTSSACHRRVFSAGALTRHSIVGGYISLVDGGPVDRYIGALGLGKRASRSLSCIMLGYPQRS